MWFVRLVACIAPSSALKGDGFVLGSSLFACLLVVPGCFDWLYEKKMMKFTTLSCVCTCYLKLLVIPSKNVIAKRNGPDKLQMDRNRLPFRGILFKL